MVKPALSRKRQRTRAALIEATLALVEERGFAGVTLSEVAQRAGVTKGAIFSNFRGKGELLWAAAGTKAWYVVPSSRPGATMKEYARQGARALMASLPAAEREADFFNELHVYMRTDPELRALQGASQTALFDAITRGMESELGDRLTMPPRALSLAFQALIRGFSAQWTRTPDEVTENVVAEAFEALLVGAVTPR
jgi:AcrR family transcriptional regulator